jgi:hypothetical protein
MDRIEQYVKDAASAEDTISQLTTANTKLEQERDHARQELSRNRSRATIRQPSQPRAALAAPRRHPDDESFDAWMNNLESTPTLGKPAANFNANANAAYNAALRG